jgi:fructokinase
MQPILCFGEALIDFHAAGNDERGFAKQFVPFAGGAPANVAVAVALLGGAARFAGMLGADRFGDFLLDQLQHAGVGTTDVVRTNAANTALAFVTLDAKGERSFSFYRPPSADLLFRASDFGRDTFNDVAIFHVCSNSLTDVALAEATCEGMRRARNAGALVSFDLNLRPALWPQGSELRPQLWPALHLADIVKLSAEEFAYLAVDGEDAALEALWQGSATLLIVTDGDKPMRWFHPDMDGELPCYSVSMVDATAAGDAFVGGLLFQLAELDGRGAERLQPLLTSLPHLHAVLRYAAACGAIAVGRQGSFTAMPTDAETRHFMETNA